MKEYRTYGVRLPVAASSYIEDVAERTGIQKAVLLRSIVLEWITARSADQHTHRGCT